MLGFSVPSGGLPGRRPRRSSLVCDAQPGRVLVSKEVLDRLTKVAESRGTTTSKLADHVFAGFLSEMERVIYGRAGETEVVVRDDTATPESGQKIRGVVFHMGALVENMDKMTQLAAVHMLQESHSVKIPIQKFNEIISSPISMCNVIAKHLPNRDREIPVVNETILKECVQVFRKFYSEKKALGPFPGARNLALRVQQTGCKVAVVGDGAHEFLEAALDGLGMTATEDPVVDVLVGKQLVDEKSQSPGSLKQRLQRVGKGLELPLESCVYIDTNPENFAEAHSLGMRLIGVAEAPLAPPVAVTRQSTGFITFEDILGHRVPLLDDGAAEGATAAEESDEGLAERVTPDKAEN